MDFKKVELKALVHKLTDEFASYSVGHSWKKLVEMVGLQVHTLRKTGELYYVFEPDCVLNDLAANNIPAHYRFTNLILHPRENVKLIPVK